MYKLKPGVPKSIFTRLVLELICLDYGYKNTLLKFLERLLYKRRDHGFKPEKILVFRRSGLGDSVCALPAIQSIRNYFPDAAIDLLTSDNENRSPGIAEIIAPGYFNETIKYRRFFTVGLIKQIRGKNYDLFIELPSNVSSFKFEVRSMLLPRLAGIRYGTGWLVSTTRVFRHYQEKYFSFFNEQERLKEVLKSSGIVSQNLNAEAALKHSPEAERNVNELLASNHLQEKNRNISFLIGAGRPQNKWPLSYFSQLADYYTNRGFNILLLGGRKECDDASELCAGLKNRNVFNFCGITDPITTAELLRNSALTIGNDTGPMHLSYTVGTPVVAIFSCRDYSGKWFPPGENKNENIVLKAENISCALCFSSSCENNICMQAIKPEMVIEKANLLLKN